MYQKGHDNVDTGVTVNVTLKYWCHCLHPWCGHWLLWLSHHIFNNVICWDFPSLALLVAMLVFIGRTWLFIFSMQSCPLEFAECKYRLFGYERQRISTLQMTSTTWQWQWRHKWWCSPAWEVHSIQNSRPCQMSLSSSSPFIPVFRACPLAIPAQRGVSKQKNFERRRQKQIKSDPMYSHFGGYKPKMCLRVDGC